MEPIRSGDSLRFRRCACQWCGGVAVRSRRAHPALPTQSCDRAGCQQMQAAYERSFRERRAPQTIDLSSYEPEGATA